MNQGPHILVYGDSGSGKSTFAATLIQPVNDRPVLVQAFDPNGKLRPYRARGNRIERVHGIEIDVEHVYRDDKLLAIIERWHERHGAGSRGITMKGGKQLGFKPTGSATKFELYFERMKRFLEDGESDNYYALVIDSTTFMELAIRSYLSERMNVNDNMMIWAQATDEMERLLMFILPDLDLTTVVLAHTDADKTVTEMGQLHHPSLPGRLQKNVLAAFDEVYHPIVKGRREDGAPIIVMQTRSDSGWRCSSQLGVPNPMQPHWREVYGAIMAQRIAFGAAGVTEAAHKAEASKAAIEAVLLNSTTADGLRAQFADAVDTTTAERQDD